MSTRLGDAELAELEELADSNIRMTGVNRLVCGSDLKMVIDNLKIERAVSQGLLDDLEAARVDLAKARQEARAQALLEVADFCLQAATYRERIAGETFDSAALEHRIAAVQLNAIRSAVLATLPQVEAKAERQGS